MRNDGEKTYPLFRVYQLLEPGPVVLVTTMRRGRANFITQKWPSEMEFEPPLVGCVISGCNHSFDALVATKECVLNIPSVELAKQVVVSATALEKRWTSSRNSS